MIMPVNASEKKQGLRPISYMKVISDLNDGIHYSVLQRTLDSVAAEIKIPFYAIKMDVENFEFFVLKVVRKYCQISPIINTELWTMKTDPLLCHP